MFFNSSSQFSVPKWKTTCSQWKILFHEIVNIKKLLIGWFFSIEIGEEQRPPCKKATWPTSFEQMAVITYLPQWVQPVLSSVLIGQGWETRKLKHNNCEWTLAWLEKKLNSVNICKWKPEKSLDGKNLLPVLSCLCLTNIVPCVFRRVLGGFIISPRNQFGGK